jgi:hypothetical protein
MEMNSKMNENDRYEWIKATPRKSGMKTLPLEIKRLRIVNEFGINADFHLKDVPDDVLKLLRERAAPEGAYQMKRQRPASRYALLGCF